MLFSVSEEVSVTNQSVGSHWVVGSGTEKTGTMKVCTSMILTLDYV